MPHKTKELGGTDYSKIRKKEVAQYAALGALAGPTVGGLANLVSHGTIQPPTTSIPRWLMSSMLAGAAHGGVVPVLRRQLHDYNVDTAKSASVTGQDMRMSSPGTIKPPTDDSKTFAAQSLKASQSVAGVGPRPRVQEGPSIRDLAAHPTNSRAGSLPKLGSSMTFQSDPLVQYLRKVAANLLETNHSTGPIESDNLVLPEPKEMIDAGPSKALEDNADAMVRAEPVERNLKDDRDPSFPAQAEQKSEKGLYLGGLFDVTSGARPKYKEKVFEPDLGVIDRVLAARQ